jgi:hypothetical protein
LSNTDKIFFEGENISLISGLFWEHLGLFGVNVMITIFGEFNRFSAEKICDFLIESNVMISVLHKLHT